MRKKTNPIWYILGSAALAIAAFVAMPYVIDYLSDKFYEPNEIDDDDDWGPEIVRKEKGDA